MKYDLVGIDGNAFSLMGYTSKAMKTEGFSKEEINEVMSQAKSGDYNNLLCVLSDAIDKCNERAGEIEDDYDDYEEDA